MVAEVITTQFGTRIIQLKDGCSIMLEKHEGEAVDLTVLGPLASGMRQKIKVQLTQSDLLSLIEFSAVAARKGTGVELVDTLPELPASLPGCAFHHDQSCGSDCTGRH